VRRETVAGGRRWAKASLRICNLRENIILIVALVQYSIRE